MRKANREGRGVSGLSLCRSQGELGRDDTVAHRVLKFQDESLTSSSSTLLDLLPALIGYYSYRTQAKQCAKLIIYR